MRTFLRRFGALFHLVLSGFDRLRFAGASRLLNNPRGVDSYLYRHRIRYVDFPDHAQELTRQLCDRTEADARAAGVPLRHLNSPLLDKEAAARALAGGRTGPAGRLALLTCVESCSTYRLRKDARGWVKPVKEPAKCLHYYHYFDHPDFGPCYARVQSWFPFTVHVGLNGRHWLCRQLERRGVPFERRDNLLVAVADPALAQDLLDAQRRADWPALLADLVRPVQPLWDYLHGPGEAPYYWMTAQSEWATDCVCHSPDELAAWYRRWLRHGIEALGCHDVLRYLGKKAPAACRGEVKADLRGRPEGVRLKYWYGGNSLKVYDKAGCALRIETTINRPDGFTVFRTKEGAAAGEAPAWRPLRKGVADFDRYAAVSQAANSRLAEGLAAVAEPTTLGELLKPLGRPVSAGGRRRARALNPLAGPDGELLRAVGRGDFLVRGFRNRDVRAALYAAAADPAERRRQSAAVTRRLALLRAHGLLVRVTGSHRYHLSAAGRRVVAALAAAHASDVNRLTADP